MNHDSNSSRDKQHAAETGGPVNHATSRDGSPHVGSSDGDAREAAARQLGFRSYAALVASSTPITSRDGLVHLIVESHDGRWIVWRETTWPEYRTFDSIHHAGRAADEGTG